MHSPRKPSLLRGRFRRSAPHRDIDKEIRYHFDRLVQQYLASESCRAN